ncbi:sensor histidine kinase [Defluviitalea saccharophila]|uniref:histidine kinase n=1 Tax=Defluviitalea saccharophila TaxID=879970 RepID=A0ABZ2Y7E0_9FIRM
MKQIQYSYEIVVISLDKIINYIKCLKIRTKIIVIYITLLVLSFIIGISTIYAIFKENTEREVGEAGLQTINALKGNLDVIFDNITQSSNMIYFDKDIQQALASVNHQSIAPSTLLTIQNSLLNMILSGKYISSVILIDSYDNYYKSYKVGPIAVHTKSFRNTEWYHQMLKSKGDGFFIHKSENIIQYPSRPTLNYITYVREIADKNDYKYLATLLLVIDESVFQKYFDEVTENDHSTFCIVDARGNYIIPPSENKDEIGELLKGKITSSPSYQSVKFLGTDAMLVQRDLGIQDWSLVGILNMNSKQELSNAYKSILIAFVALNLIIIIACVIVLTRLIFSPLTKVQRHMQMVESGEFVPMPIEEGYENEIISLKQVFNHMIYSLQELIEKIKQEEKIIMKNELDIIHAQINPHFLYNTLDAASALALLNDNKNCFKLIQALGNFYRNSLNSGKDVVTVADEIACIKNYITILNIRYDNRIKIHYDIEDRMLPLPMLKLILQPVVENAVYHGIKEREGEGNIHLKGYLDEDEMIFIISDDGMGMNEERIKEVLEGKTRTNKSGFGLYSLIQRISLYYNIESPVTVTSEIGSGTEITIRLKVIKGDEYCGN